MPCGRCRGFMVKDHLYDLLENDGQLYLGGFRWGYQCIGCGHVVEPAMEQDETVNAPIAIGVVASHALSTNPSNLHPSATPMCQRS